MCYSKKHKVKEVLGNYMFDTLRSVLVECIRSVYVCMRRFYIGSFWKADLTTIIGCRIH
jgi:hypothetical protein